MNNDTEIFLDALLGGNLEPAHFATFDDRQAKRKAFAQRVYGSIEDLDDKLCKGNALGAGIFITVNETNGTGAKTDNITKVRALFVDFDDMPYPEYHLPPSIIVQRDTTHHHAYWLVDDCPMDAFKGCQKRLIQHYGSDPAIHDLGRVMRLPGYKHMKGDPVDVHLVDCTATKYSLHQIMYGIEEIKNGSAPKITQIDNGTIPKGQRHEFFKQTAAQLKSMGFSPAEIYKTLQTRRDERCDDPSDVKDEHLISISEWFNEKEVGVTVEDVVRGGVFADAILKGFEQDMRELTEHGGDVMTEKTEPMPKHLLNGIGIIGEISEWIEAQAHRSQPELALMATMTFLGAIYGRKIQGYRDARTNLYTIGICGTGGGKENAREHLKRLFRTSGSGGKIGVEELASDAGLMGVLKETNTQVMPVDEIGKLLRCMKDGDRNPHQYAVVTALLKIYTSANDVYKGKAYANTQKNVEIDQPCLCIFGTTTPSTLYDSLTKESVRDGFLGRVLFVRVSDDLPKMNKRSKKLPVPRHFVEHIQQWDKNNMNSDGDDMGIAETMGWHEPEDAPMSEEAEDIFFEYMETVDDFQRKGMKDDADTAALWGRAAQKVAQVSLICACAKYDRMNVVIDKECMQYAIELVTHLTKNMIIIAKQNIVESQAHKEMLMVLDVIRKAGKTTFGHISRNTPALRRQNRQEALQNLMDQGRISQDGPDIKMLD